MSELGAGEVAVVAAPANESVAAHSESSAPAPNPPTTKGAFS